MHSIHLPSLPSSSSSSSFSPIASVHPSPLAPHTSPPRLRIIPVPLAHWPLWTRALAKFRHPADTGLGDTLVHLIGDARSERFKKWFTRKFGKTCGCTERQRWLNQKFPYAD